MTSVASSQKKAIAFRYWSVSSRTLPPGQYGQRNRDHRPGDERERDADLRRHRRDRLLVRGALEDVRRHRDPAARNAMRISFEDRKPRLRRQQQDDGEGDQRAERASRLPVERRRGWQRPRGRRLRPPPGRRRLARRCSAHCRPADWPGGAGAGSHGT